MTETRSKYVKRFVCMLTVCVWTSAAAAQLRVATVFAFATAGNNDAQRGEVMNSRTPKMSNPRTEDRVEDILGRMTLEEKIQLLGGTGMDTKPNTRLGIPTLKMADGPHGVRLGKATCFPTGVAMASGWDAALMERVGVALAREILAKGRNVLLGPCVNIHRVPHGGRNFESFGEDPYLAARMAVAYVRGVQSRNVVACTKHFACNNQETERTTIDVEIDHRTLREIYLPAFKAVVQEADTWAIMAAYNKVNGPYACANKPLLMDILKNEWGFDGLVMSDWNATHSTVESANAGLDLEMPTDVFFGNKLLQAVKQGDVPESVIDDKIRRILRIMFLANLFDRTQTVGKSAFDEPAHRALALEVAQAGIVLLKNNDGLLPLDRDRTKSIAVIGPNAAIARLGGSGSSEVTPSYSVSPLEGILKKARGGVQVRYAAGCTLPDEFVSIDSCFLAPPDIKEGDHGLRGEYFDNQKFEGKPVVTRVDSQVGFDWGGEPPAPGIKADHFSARWTGKLIPPKTGNYLLTITSDDGSRLHIDDELVINNWGDHATQTVTHTVELEAGKPYDIRIEYYEAGGAAIMKLGWVLPGTDSFAEAVRIAAESDVAIVFAGLSKRFEGEGSDKTDLELPGRQNKLIETVRKANKNTVVVLINGTPLLMDRWIDKVPALIEAWYPGQEGGHAIADILFGDVNPSGKLPVTFPKTWEDCPACGHFPGKADTVRYAEGILVGYRHFDKNGVDPLFPFGHGLSYTTFQYDGLKITPEEVSSGDMVHVCFRVKNTGQRKGKEVVQLYVRDTEASVVRPTKELKGFQKITLKPGESKDVTFELSHDSMSFYDTTKEQWVVEPGRFEVLIGSSSRDIRLQGDFVLK